jgi:hypothetical protein
MEQGMCHTIALPFTLKSIFKAKRRIMEIHFTMQKYNLQKNLHHTNPKPKILQDIITL